MPRPRNRDRWLPANLEPAERACVRSILPACRRSSIKSSTVTRVAGFSTASGICDPAAVIPAGLRLNQRPNPAISTNRNQSQKIADDAVGRYALRFRFERDEYAMAQDI